jgi:hypothetical protein
VNIHSFHAPKHISLHGDVRVLTNTQNGEALLYSGSVILNRMDKYSETTALVNFYTIEMIGIVVVN